MMQYGMNRQQQPMTQAQRQAQGGRGRGAPSPVAVPAPPIPQSPVGYMGGRGYPAPRGGQAGYAQPKASPRTKQPPAAPAGGVPAPPPPSTPKGSASAGTPKPGAAAASAVQPPEDVKPLIPAQQPIDFEFLGLISEILRLVEGFSSNSEEVRCFPLHVA